MTSAAPRQCVLAFAGDPVRLLSRLASLLRLARWLLRLRGTRLLICLLSLTLLLLSRLNLTLLCLTLKRLLTLFRRLFIPRNFNQLRWLLAHIGLHLFKKLTLFWCQLLRRFHFTTGRRFCWCTHTRLATFQLFNVAPAFFWFRW